MNNIITVTGKESRSDYQSQEKPVIFIAFANDKVNHTNYLRNLALECGEIRKTLDRVKNKGLCEVVVRTSASIEDIFDVFQDENYRDRIAIFHYGGHADCYQLLLETHDGRHLYASRQGLVPFFARQKSLRLVFLNACSTQQHALDLISANIPAVIGTSQDINDEVATKLAIRFYKGIANGSVLERAWQEAEDEIKVQYGLFNLANIYWYGEKGPIDRFPWDIYFKEGVEKIKEWNLPDAANDHLFGLPPIPDTHILPDTPFLFLNRFERKHAELFFGRSYYIRRLYDYITDSKTSPFILLYGQSGVGKSSLLEAGLLPRLEQSHTVLYTRRLQEKGLLRTLEDALDSRLLSLKKGNKKLTMWMKWGLIEFKTRKPLIIILDQVEQAYANNNNNFPYEFEYFISNLKNGFENPAKYPRGKLILVYRKEYHPEIDEQFKKNELDRRWLFLQPLNRQDIIEVITGLTRTKRLQDKYHLNIEDGLLGNIADNLLEDKDSPICPTLQIILTKLWESSDSSPSPYRVFTVDQYWKLRKEGLLMEDFLEQQMEKLGNWNKEIFDSGLALDLLKFHTNEWGMSCSRSIKDIEQRYRHCWGKIVELLEQLKNVYLLTDTQKNNSETGLAHDTLAPIVIKEYNESDKPGQRAARIVNARIGDFKKNPGQLWLNKLDMEVVEEGKIGMRSLCPEEEELLKKSRKQWEYIDKQIRTRRKALLVSTILFMGLVIFATWQWSATSYKEKMRKKEKANYLVSLAQSNVEKDPTIALRLAEEAWKLDKNSTTNEMLHKILKENNFYKIIIQQKKAITSVAFSPHGNHILTGTQNGIAQLWDLRGNKLHDLKGHTDWVASAAFSPDGRYIITGSKDRTAILWDLSGAKIQNFQGHNDWINSTAFSPDGRYIITGSRDRTAILWDRSGNQLQAFNDHRGAVTAVAFSPDGKCILTGSEDNFARLWDLEGKLIRNFKEAESIVRSIAFSPDGRYFLMGSDDGSFRLLDIEGTGINAFMGHRGGVYSVAFSPDGKYFLTGSEDTTARLWELKEKEINEKEVFLGHEDIVQAAAFSGAGKDVVTGSFDKTVRLWKSDISLKEIQQKDSCERLSKEQQRAYGIDD